MQRLAIALALGSGGAWTEPAHADAPVRVDVELLLAVDVSRSMTPRELEIQRRGYAEALVSPDVIDVMSGGGTGRVAIAYVEWAGTHSQRVIVDWTLIRGRADAEAFAAKLTAEFNSALRRTSISGILDYAAGAFEENGFAGARRVVDISGDGPNNQGRPVTAARDALLAGGITINGLPLMTREGMGAQWHLDDLDAYYRDCVIGGPMAFVLPVLDWAHFPTAVRRKLILELAGRMPEPEPVPEPEPERDALPLRRASGGYDCLIGEKIWQEMMGDWN
ncbi:MAG: DUF1194 domain-containing protein [Pseudomonadota bacterium]